MAKGAAKEKDLAQLHSFLTKTYTRVLERYEARFDLIDGYSPEMDKEKLEEDMVEAVLDLGWEPNPAMLNSISAFLKQNDIQLDSDEVETLNSTERRLADRRAARAKAGLMSLDEVTQDVVN